MDKLCLLHTHRGKPITPRTLASTRTAVRLAIGGCIALSLTGCASPPPQASKPDMAAPLVVSMEEWMAQARAALNEGNREKARAAYRAAAQSHPTEKLPWLRLSEDYFDAQDYGNAVIAAQEALQRDGQDNLAHSILAVSGLRLTAGSLAALRQDTAYPVGSRDEAITVARALRDTLGATSLLTPPAPGNPAARSRKPAPAAAAVPRAGAAAPSAAPAVVPISTTTPSAARPAAPKPTGSPLDKLK